MPISYVITYMPKSREAILAFTEKQIDRFHASVVRSDGCWLWSGTIQRKSPIFSFGNSQMTAHRAAWLIANGHIGAGFDVYRTCNQWLCVRPDHLRIGKTGSSPFSRQQRLAALSVKDESGCINFIGSRDRLGYGKFDGALAHRAAWEVHNGPIPVGLYVCHKCDNPSCINPEHLFVGTQLENVRDMIAKGRQSYPGAPVGHIGARRKLTQEQAELARIAYSTGEVNMHQIALVLGIDQSCISRIVNGSIYKTSRAEADPPTSELH